MSLAFNVNNASPISQIGVTLFSFDTSFWIASSAYGWYKNREQILTFARILEAKGITLRSNNFDAAKYNSQRINHGNVWAAYSNGMKRLSRVVLPNASTARMGGSGLWCLRALVTGLLCFVRQEAIQTILSNILPEYLLDFELEGSEFSLEGPLRAALNRLIEEVAGEESVDQFLDKLHENLDLKMKLISKGSSLSDVLECQQLEIPQIIGLLRWLFTSVHRRTCLVYPTASLRVWGIAFVLHELGFEIDVSMIAVTDPLLFEEVLRERQQDFPKVCLVLHRKVTSDPEAPRFPSTSSSSYKALTKRPPRLIPVQGIPALIIQELIEEKGHTCDDLIAIEEIFFETFEHVNQYMNSLSYIRRAAGFEPQPGNTTYSSPRNKLDTETLDYLQILFPDVTLDKTNDLLQAMLSPIKKYIPSLIHSNNNFLTTIIYSSLLATAILFVRYGASDIMDRNSFEVIYDYPMTTYTHKRLSKNYPKIFVWLESMLEAVSAIRKVFSGGDDLYVEAFDRNNRFFFHQCRMRHYLKLRTDWSQLLFQLIAQDSSTQSNDQYLFGIQTNGLCLISDFVLDPSVDCSKPFVYHIQRGQLLDIVLRDGALIDTKAELLSPISIHFGHSEPVHIAPESLTAAETPHTDSFRWEVQPHWEADPLGSCLMIRSSGIPRVQLRFTQLLESIYDETTWKALCRDETNEHEHTKLPAELMTSTPDSVSGMPSDGLYTIIPLCEMLVEGNWLLGHSPGDSNAKYWLIDARGSEILLLLALAMQFGEDLQPSLRIVTNCFSAAYQLSKDRARDLPLRQSTDGLSSLRIPLEQRFLIILVNEDYKRNWLRIGSTDELRPRSVDEAEEGQGPARAYMEIVFQNI